jgi:DNA primase
LEEASPPHRCREVLGLCPLHRESVPSFYVNRRKQVFYCHGCDRGGGLARLIQLLEGRPVPDEECFTPEHLLEKTYRFYRRQLARSETARAFLAGRGIHDPEVIQRICIGYAPGACLRGYLTRRGYSHHAMLLRGLVDFGGRDCCLTFHLEQCGNLYGRSLTNGLCRHRCLPGSKGGLYG